MTSSLLSPRSTLRRQTTSALALITLLAWAYLFFLSARMGDMGSSFAMPMTSSWTAADIMLMWTMWAVMMAGMMLPSATPMISAYATTATSGIADIRGSTPFFVAGYLATWCGFAAVATTAQWALHDAALLGAMGETTSGRVGGLLLLGAGFYQFTSVKDACLRQCRTPLGFLLNEWRPGRGGAFVMGIRHGSLCVGCCWALMALLFVLGVMNLWWIALLAAVVLLEKVVPTERFSRTLGAVLLLWGTGLVLGLTG